MVPLHFNGFETNFRISWKEFSDENYFFDVTLTSEGNEIKSTKVMLGSYSPILKNILKIKK